MDKTCKKCHNLFTINSQDQIFYEKISVPKPTFCLNCRTQRRLSFRNERNLYKRTCDLCQKQIIAAYQPKTIFPVYCPECGRGDKWDALNYGLILNTNDPFSPQFHELLKKVPLLSLAAMTSRAQNCDF